MYKIINQLILKDMPLFFESDKVQTYQVSPTVSRKMIHLNNLMVCIVEIKGPMEKPEPMHSHIAEQIAYIVKGRVIVTIGDQSKQLKAGDMFSAPSGVSHTIQVLDECLVLIDSFNPIREEFL